MEQHPSTAYRSAGTPPILTLTDGEDRVAMLPRTCNDYALSVDVVSHGAACLTCLNLKTVSPMIKYNYKYNL